MVLAGAANVTLGTNAHEEINRLLAELERTGASSCRFDVLIIRLVCAIHHETLHEELDVFPRLADYTGERMLIALGDQVEKFEDPLPVT